MRQRTPGILRSTRWPRPEPDEPEAPAGERRLPVGAEVLGKKGVHFRVWAPRSKTVSVQPGRDSGGANSNASIAELEPEGDGYFSGRVAAARPGMLYKFRLDSGAFPDPASRFQPDGPHGPSAIVDPQRFKWTDAEWAGVPRERRVMSTSDIRAMT